MNQQLKHLTDRQIEQYVGVASAEGPAQNNDEIEAHFANCDYCRGRYLEAERTHLGILEHHVAKTPYPECPDEESLEEYAAGLCSPKIAAEIRTHAARCNFCAPRLRQYLKDFSEELPDEAKSLLDRLPAATKEWRQEFVRKHVVRRTLLQRLKTLFHQWLKALFDFFRGRTLAWRASMTGAFALLIIAAVLAPNIIANKKLNQAEELTVAAFKENPNTKHLRYALTPPAFEMKLGGEGGTEDCDSPTRIAAKALANEKLTSGNPKWLQINGRLELLCEKVDAADFLQSAYDNHLQDPGTEIDLAAAYFLRDTKAAQRSHVDVPDVKIPDVKIPDVNKTVDLLKKVLGEPNLSPEEKATATYDLAIAYETMIQLDLAVSAWKHYLELDRTGPWAEEAERHLEADQHKVPVARPETYDTPAFFDNLSSELETQSADEYQDITLRKWLPEFIGEHSAEAMQAARKLAGILEKEHQDTWMKDLLNHTTDASDLAGLQELGAAITDNKRGLPANAMQHAKKAQVLFKQTGNTPGLSRARFEAMYANQRSWDGQACLKQAERLDAALRGTTYRWLQIQLALTQAACLYRQNQFEAADKHLRIGHQNAKRFGFHVLELRALSVNAGMKVTRDCNESWQAVVSGLESYWGGPSLPRRLYEFYASIKQCLVQRKLWHAAEALERRMIFILENEMHRADEDLSFEETARTALIEILIQINKSGSINFPLEAKDPVFATYQLPFKLRLAEYQLTAGDEEAANTILTQVKDLVESKNDELIRMSFYRVYGDVLLKMHQVEEAATAYKTGLEIAERAFGNLKTDENRLPWSKETGELYRGLIDILLARGENVRALQLWEWYQSRPWASAANQTGSRQISWPQIEGEILGVPVSAPAGGIRLIYAFIRDRVCIWTVSGSGVRMPAPVKITLGEIQQQIARYAENISTKNPNMVSLEVDSEHLFSLLLEPIMPDLSESATVIVELDPMMKDLIVEALKSPKGWYFGLRYPVVYSAGVVKETELRPISRRLPTSTWSLNAVTANDRSPFDTLNGMKFQNALNLTMTQISDRLRNTEMFFFIGHGMPGGLLMPDGRPLGAEGFPIASLQNLQLAALVACSSGSSQDGMPDTSNLVHALLSGGVPSVIASQWDVSREKTDQLFGSFYNHFQQGETPARAMLAARQEVFNGHNSQHPYYWAAFTLSGRAD
jgi:CHAT domain-containing protein